MGGRIIIYLVKIYERNVLNEMYWTRCIERIELNELNWTNWTNWTSRKGLQGRLPYPKSRRAKTAF